jgi:hypothetical protein
VIQDPARWALLRNAHKRCFGRRGNLQVLQHVSGPRSRRWRTFQLALSAKRKYPIQAFKGFWEAGWRYAELTKRDPLIHRVVVEAVNGLPDFLTSERKRVPEKPISDAQRLESLVFSGYDPQFEGDEPPGL